ncbi:phage tail tape measure protein [Roseateles sp.]|uniref:phage tail tape measure protein n=1 Tax=Roseateles sp. TaxID=1971397 RepID=UPI003BA80DAA
MATRDETLRLQFEVEGIGNLRDLRTQIEQLGAQGQDSAAELSQLTDALTDAGALQQSVARLRELSQQYIGLQQSLREAQAATIQLDAASKASAANQAALRSAIADQQEGLQALAAAARRGEISEEQRQRASAEARVELQRLTAELREAEASQRRYDAELDKSRGTISKLVTQQERLREPIQQIRGELEKAGVASKTYSGAQAELQARAAQSRAALDALANSVSQQVSTNRAAAASVQQLADANETLGRRGFGDITAEIQRVRAAYETLRASGTLSTRELAQAQSRLIERTRELQSEYGSLGASLQQVQGSLIAAGASLFTVTRTLSTAATAASQFQRSLAAISTIAPQADLAALGDSVRALTREFGGDAARNAAALYEIIAAGVEDTTQALQILRVANQLAIGGLADTEVAASGLVATLNAYGLAADQATRVSDAFFVAAAAGNTTIEELSQSIGGVAPLAASVGVSVEQLTSAVGALTAGGLDTGQAFTQIQSALTAVVKPTAEAKRAAEELGIQFDVAALRSQGLQQFLQGVSTAAQGNETTLATLFGRVEALQGVLALTGNQADAFAKALGDMENGAGRTAEAFAKLQETPEQAFARFQAAVGDLRISFGQTVTALTPLLEGFTSILNLFNQLPTGIRAGIAGITALAAVITPLAIAIAQSRAALVLLLGSLRALGPAAAGAGAGVGVFTTAATGATVATTRLTASMGALSRAFAVLGAAAVGFEIGTALNEPLTRYRLSVDEAAQSTVRFAVDVDAIGQAGAEAAAKFSNFGGVAVKTAAEVRLLGEEQRETYRTSLEGLNAFLRGRAEELIAQQRSTQLTAEQRAELDGLFGKLDQVRLGFANLDSAALGAAESIAQVAGSGASPAVAKLAEDLRKAAGDSKELGDALSGAFKGIDFDNSASRLGEIALAIDQAASSSAAAGAAIRDELAKELQNLSGAELLRFQQAAQFAFESAGEGAGAAAQILDATLAESYRRLGVNVEAAGVKITKQGQDIIASFRAIASSGNASAQAIGAAFSAALNKSQTTGEVQALEDALRSAFAAGKISAQQLGAALSAAGARAADITSGALEAQGALDGLGEAGRRAARDLIASLQAARAGLETEAGNLALAIQRGLSKGEPVAELQQQLAGLQAEITGTSARITGLQNELGGVGDAGEDAGRRGANGIGTLTPVLKDAALQAKETAAAVDDIGQQGQQAGEKVKLGVSNALLGLIQVTKDARDSVAELGPAAVEAFDRLRGELGLVDTTGRSTADVMQLIADRAGFAAKNAEELALQIGNTEERVKRTREEMERLQQATQQASSELSNLVRQQQDQADRRDGNEEAIRRRQYEEELRRIEELAQAGGASAAVQAAQARQLARKNFEADIADIRAKEREQIDSNRRVDDDRRRRDGGGSAGAGLAPTAAPNAPVAGGFAPVINITGVTDPEEAARQVIREIEKLQRRGFNGRTGL